MTLSDHKGKQIIRGTIPKYYLQDFSKNIYSTLKVEHFSLNRKPLKRMVITGGNLFLSFGNKTRKTIIAVLCVACAPLPPQTVARIGVFLTKLCAVFFFISGPTDISNFDVTVFVV
jgi:hypothetical protein